ncbi:MAG: hypothetical protein UT33_C0007G0073 [Candidatus Peregrinibacteria bacterium GW2011_GWC2_39_14]|nr:MAG: hypothetical protein US92_C0002G0074 [Candidatus Peregrinibacteria bacterium GW2011_GWA2_38_36]KKR06885.1 MAG: hypothetical protein UT33_C0007G0073 [Candidatus Peregrinibacteria bacterium GW2011_GWC2_39_14]
METRDQHLEGLQGNALTVVNQAFEALAAVLEKLGADREGIKIRVELVYSSPESDKPATLHAHMDVDVNLDLSHVDAVEPANVADVIPPVDDEQILRRTGLGQLVVYPPSYLDQFPVLQEEVQPALEFFKGHQRKKHSQSKGVEDILATNFGSYVPSSVLMNSVEDERVAAGLSQKPKHTIARIINTLVNGKLKKSPYAIESIPVSREQPDLKTGRSFYTAYRIIRKPGVDVKVSDLDGKKPSKGREKPSEIYELAHLDQFPLIEDEVQPALDWFDAHRRGGHSDSKVFEYLFSANFGKYILRSSIEKGVLQQREKSSHPADKKLATVQRLLGTFKNMKMKDSPYMLERIPVYCEDGRFNDGARKYDYAYRMVKKDVKSKKDELPDREELANLPILEDHVQPATKVVEDNFLLDGKGSKGVSRAIFFFLAKNVGRYFAPSNSDWLSFVSDQVKGGSGSVNSGSFHATLVSSSGVRLTDLLSKIELKLDKRTCKGLGTQKSCIAFGIVPIEK